MNDIISVLQWYSVFLILGIIFFPFTALVFKSFTDRGYIFSKIFGMLLVSYVVFILGIIKIIPFTYISITGTIFVAIIANLYILKKYKPLTDLNKSTYIIIFEEVLFFLALCFWSFIRAHEPSINGLEKFMDYGFVNSVLRAEYFPPKDIWFAPFSINYYYFGHLVTAVLTKISFLPSNITYNLMIATLFAFTISASFSIAYNLASLIQISHTKKIITGILGAILVSLSGNLHVIYAFFQQYTPSENPVPFWTLTFKPLALLTNGYWYPNATRFIPNTIHEFPLYSFVVSDLHGHVLDIPVVLLMLAAIYTVVIRKTMTIWHGILFGFLLSVMYMTNVLDFGVYFLLILLSLSFIHFQTTKGVTKKNGNNTTTHVKRAAMQTGKHIGVVLMSMSLFSLPFSIFFKPFASGIGIICGNESVSLLFKPFAIAVPEKIGPLLLEPNHCARSEWWMLATLYFFFYFFVVILFVYLWRNPKRKKAAPYAMVTILATLATVLILIPEFAYIKDIYPDHYRANTMFKLTYQAFIMLSLVSAFVAGAILTYKNRVLVCISIILISLVLLYSRFAILSYYGDLSNYKGLDGTVYLKDRFPDDLEAITWLNTNVSGQPTIVESQGDSYTDHARISANTGIPTVLGWTVHEWLWRGSYDIPAPRIEEVKSIYESRSLAATRELLKKHTVSYVYIGNLERERYPGLYQEKFNELGTIIYQNNSVTLYKITE